MNYTEREVKKLLELQYGCYLKLLGPNDVDFEESDVSISTDSVVINSDQSNRDGNLIKYLPIIFSIFAVLNIGANSLLIFGLLKTNKKLNCIHKLFVYLAFIDLSAGCVAMPVFIYYELVGFTCLHMALMMSLFACIAVGDSSVLLIISVLRLYSIRDPISSQNHQKLTRIMISIQIAFSLGLASALFMIYYYGNSLVHFQLAGYLVNIVHTSISLAVLACVGWSLLTLRKYRISNSGIFTPEQMKNHTRSTSSLLLIGLTMVIFLLVQLPMFIFLHLKLKNQRILFGESFQYTKQSIDAVMLISHLNTIVNSIVIIARSKKLRRYLFHVCSRQ